MGAFAASRRRLGFAEDCAEFGYRVDRAPSSVGASDRRVLAVCCLFSTLVILGPRAGILVWWLMQPVRWEEAFSSFWWAFLGFIFAPWTTLMWVSVAPGGVNGFDYVILGIGIFADIASWSASGYERRRAMMA